MVSTTGMISREIFETREAFNDGHERDFLTMEEWVMQLQLHMDYQNILKNQKWYLSLMVMDQ